MKLLLAPVISILLCSMLSGQGCPRVEDINKTTAPYSSSPMSARVGPGHTVVSSFVKCGTFHYFTADTLATEWSCWTNTYGSLGQNLVALEPSLMADQAGPGEPGEKGPEPEAAVQWCTSIYID